MVKYLPFGVPHVIILPEIFLAIDFDGCPGHPAAIVDLPNLFLFGIIHNMSSLFPESFGEKSVFLFIQMSERFLRKSSLLKLAGCLLCPEDLIFAAEKFLFPGIDMILHEISC